jgi:hypothetical protein
MNEAFSSGEIANPRAITGSIDREGYFGYNFRVTLKKQNKKRKFVNFS